MQEHPPGPATREAAHPHEGPDPLDDPRAMQILSTEHWSLLATRSLSWNESFSRAGLFLSTVSATAVALALVGQATSFGTQFVAFALVMLPVALFVGLATFTRLDEVNAEDLVWVIGLNRIRHAYLEINPGLRPYFTAGTTDDPPGLERTFGVHRPGNAVTHWLVTMPGMIAVIDGVLAGLVIGVAGDAIGAMAMEPAIVLGALGGILVTVTLALRSRGSVRWFLGRYRPSFPSDSASLYDWSAPFRRAPSDPGGGEQRPGEPGA